MPAQKSWILVDLPPDATQLQYGAEVWRLVCSACHAYDGQGLTDEWRATWAPADQNCWQSKCHGPNHPPDGFVLPIAPAVVGEAALAPFATASDLHTYIERAMPWQDPGTLTDKDSWAVTAYVVKLNRMNPGPELNAASATEVRFREATALPAVTSTPEQSASPATATYPWIMGAAAAVLLGLAIGLRLGRRTKSGNAR
jgi:mono/diheme cytochrome c family protein